MFINDMDAEAVDQAVKAVKAEGGSVSGLPADASDEACVSASVKQVIATHGRIDVTVNNAGIMMRKPAKRSHRKIGAGPCPLIWMVFSTGRMPSHTTQ